MTNDVILVEGDCLITMLHMRPNSVDTILTDPPYGLEFMGKNWDKGVPGVPFWKSCLRVAKPGALLMAFGGTRTWHRLATAIEDAGWEIRDTLMWLQGQGFPKSHDISKAIDKQAGAEREVIKRNPNDRARRDNNMRDYGLQGGVGNGTITAPATDAAREWDGWGTALKPAWEPIIVAMKPLDGTFAQNALRWGVAGLNIDGARIGWDEKSLRLDTLRRQSPATDITGGNYGNGTPGQYEQAKESPPGRWPANVILDETAAELLDAQSGERGNNWRKNKSRNGDTSHTAVYGTYAAPPPESAHNDSGGASRFFYVAKASRRERNAGLEGMPERTRHTLNDYVHPSEGRTAPKATGGPQANNHPTVKPLALMRYLARLTATPTGGVIFDPFMGSGTTGMAAKLENRRFVGCEINAEYVEIARRRIDAAQDR